MNKYRLGLGCMGMNLKNKEDSIETINEAINNGINLINTGEFYGQGESELVVGEALKEIPRDKYFISVKFGVLPNPKACVYFIEKGKDFQGLEIKGNMEVLCDQDLKNKFWKPFFFRFYKHGPTDPDYCILKFTGFEAIYFAHQTTKTIKL